MLTISDHQEHEYMMLDHIRKDVLIVALVKYICDLNNDSYSGTFKKIIDFLIKHNLVHKNICRDKYENIRRTVQDNLMLLFSDSMIFKFNKKSHIDNPLALPSLPKAAYNNLLIDKVLGSGSESTVYKVRHTLDKNFYALKMTEYDYLSKWNIEISILSQLTHKNIVRYYNSWIDLDFRNKSDKSYLYTQIEICDMNLYDYCKTNDLSLKQKINIIMQIVTGVRFLHEHNIIHRDLKLSNMLIKGIEDPVIKISDFGCSKIFDSNIIDKTLSNDKVIESKRFTFSDTLSSEDDLGTYFYISPELLNREQYDQSTDIYSLGIVIFIILNNYLTCHEEALHLTNLDENNVILEIEDPEKLWKNLIQKCICKDKINRPDIIYIEKYIQTYIN